MEKDSRLEVIDRMLNMCDAPRLDKMLYPSLSQKETKKKYDSNVKHARAKYKARNLRLIVSSPRTSSFVTVHVRTCTQLMWLTVREAKMCGATRVRYRKSLDDTVSCDADGIDV